MPSPKHPCELCETPTKGRLCRPCSDANPYPRTPEHRAKMSKVITGTRRSSPSASTRPEVAEKIRQSWTPAMREAARQRGLAMVAAPRQRLRFGRPGMLNANFRDGGSVLPYASGWTAKVRSEVLERDAHACQDCGSQGRLDVHHKDGRKVNHALTNLVAVCRPCHGKRHRKSD